MKIKLSGFLSSLAFVLLVLCIPVLIISTTVRVYSHSADLYKAGFNKYHISQRTGISNVQLGEVAKQMVEYFGGKSSTPQLMVTKHGEQSPLYNEKELVHLEDVRYIVQIFTILQVASILLFLVLAVCIYFSSGLPRILTGIQIGSVVTAVLTGILIIWALIDFNSLFLLFHYISFTNDLWILDPSKDYLIMMFPEGFFNDAAMLIVSTIIGEAAIIWLAAFFIKRASVRKAGVAC
jgi:integral membrane protein (TIGR01906 family)